MHDVSAPWMAADSAESNSDEENDAPLSNLALHNKSPTQDIESATQTDFVHRQGTETSMAWLYTSIAAVAYVYSLDQNVTPNYLPIATSAYGKHSSIGTIFTVESVISEFFILPTATNAQRVHLIANRITTKFRRYTNILDGVSKPFMAKIADVISRPSACMCSLVFYTTGYLMIALSSSITHVIVGCLLYTVGHSGLILVTDILVADLSSLKWRGFVLSLTGLPFLVNTFVGAEIVSAILKKNAWRWGCELPAVQISATVIFDTHGYRWDVCSHPSGCDASRNIHSSPRLVTLRLLLRTSWETLR